MCVGGSNLDSDNTLLVVACGNCLSITSQTQPNKPTLLGSVYWYYSPGFSFGFAPDSLIIQDLSDTHDQTSNQRISWNLDDLNGGWRLGNFVGLNNNNSFSKKVFLKYACKFICIIIFINNFPLCLNLGLYSLEYLLSKTRIKICTIIEKIGDDHLFFKEKKS